MVGPSVSPPRPNPDEFLAYFGQYIDRVPEGDLFAVLERQVKEVCAALAELDPGIACRRPAPGEWSPLDIAVHLADTERVLTFRVFTFARNDGAELPGVDFEEFAEAANANERPIADVIHELGAVRSATLALFRSLGPESWTHRGIAGGSVVSVRALAYVVAGHDLHHLGDLIRAAAGPR